MAGIDPDQALNHVTPAMLIKLLYDFKNTYQDLPEKITACQADDDLETLRTTAHTIKGVAGYIGALPLQPAPGDRDPRGFTGAGDPLPLTEKEKKVMQHFSDLLINGELTAEELLPDIQAILTRCKFQTELAQIRELMDDIEYDSAAQIINSLLR